MASRRAIPCERSRPPSSVPRPRWVERSRVTGAEKCIEPMPRTGQPGPTRDAQSFADSLRIADFNESW